MPEPEYLYHCPNPRCARRGKQLRLTVNPAQHKEATGWPVRCRCGAVLVYDGEQPTLPFPTLDNQQ